ncbi:glycosyltransferase family 2 protein [Flavimarina sp. Hel_I_48]|uniref:glycosyltransferase family 2 protein n=1 Tax=Flavimarina sp. Hel_I_48 TaxID=1392488 RepID=UPI000B289BF6|nr:glycosyltransferase [Flavimarina sp. Hel_I_48]
MNNLISIILPVYNGEQYLKEAIESCLNQTYTNFELIIVDDCSTDATLEVAKKYSGKDHRVSIISNEVNKKLPASLNIGHHEAKGEYLTWTSDDNILKKNMLSSLLQCFKGAEHDLVFSNYDVIEANGKFRRTHHFGPVCSLPFGSCIGASFLYRRRVFFELGGYDERLHTIEDYDFWLRAALKYRFFHLEESLYKYRVHQKNLTSTIDNNKDFRDAFKQKHNIVHDKWLIQVNGSEETKNFLMMVKRFRKWDWKVLKIHYQEIINDLLAFQNLTNSNDKDSVLVFLDAVLRNNLIVNPADKSFLLWLLYKRPGIIFNSNYSKRNTLKILKSIF